MWPLFFACILPFVVLFGSIFILRKSVFWSALAAVAVLLVVLVTLWQVPAATILAALVKSGLVTLDIVAILIAALFLVALLQDVGSISVIKNILVSVSPDRRIQTLLIGVFFVGFIEGIAGFGTPAMLAAPLLVVIGFPVRGAILVSLLGNTLSTAFGAVGTPFLIGLTQGITPFLSSPEGLTSGLTLQQVLLFFVAVGLPSVLIFPLVMVILLTHTFGGNWKDGLAVWRHAVLAALCYSIPFYSIALIFGFEFPALLGSLLGGIAFILLLRLPFFTIKHPWTFSDAKSKHTDALSVKKNSHIDSNRAKVFAGIPYLVTVLFLILSRLPSLPFHSVAYSTFALTISEVAGVQVQHTLRPLYSPALFLLMGALAALIIYKPSKDNVKKLLGTTLTKIYKPTKTLLTLIFLAQLLLFSGMNSGGKPSIPVFAATMVSTIPVAWPLIAPFIGMFGALIAGSVTVSNILFAGFQAETAQLGEYSIPLVLALQVLGATGGNIIALHNIIAVLAATDSKISERSMLILLIKPALIYAVYLGLFGYGLHVFLKM